MSQETTYQEQLKNVEDVAQEVRGKYPLLEVHVNRTSSTDDHYFTPFVAIGFRIQDEFKCCAILRNHEELERIELFAAYMATEIVIGHAR